MEETKRKEKVSVSSEAESGATTESNGSSVQDVDKDRKMFARKKSCWFCAKKTDPQWKDPSSYAWLVNEFGKIAPGRVSGLCTTHQRMATTSIKRGRNLGLIAYISGRTAH